jgi:predicted ATPase
VAAKLKSITVSGFKSLGDVTLPLDGLSVLIGDNGSGKSSILEVLEILRCTAHEGFLGRISSAHGGVLVTEHGARGFTLIATIDDGADEPLQYALSWLDTTAPVEAIHRGSNGAVHELPFIKASREARIAGKVVSIDIRESLVHFGAQRDPAVAAVAEAFRGIEVHLPFHVTAHWAAAASERRWPRGISLLEPTTKLERFGTNLVNAYQALKNDCGIDHWNETLEDIRLGLGPQVRDVRLEAIPGGGHMALALELQHQGRVPAFSLSDGVLSYLAFVALFRLDEGRTLLAFDEPELHLHPGLLMRVLGMLEVMSDRYPVVIATHSDRLLDGLSDPAKSVVVTELDERARTRLRRLDPVALERWIVDYRGLGELRADGELISVLMEDGGSRPGIGDTPSDGS